MPQYTQQSGAIFRWLGWASLALVGAVGILAAVFVFGMRSKSSRVQQAVRRVNRKFWNPRAMETAGTPGASASVIHHVGRRSNTPYRTPVGPIEVDDGFVITLPYGQRADWVKNVLAAGRATLKHEGWTYEVDQPRVMPIDSVDMPVGKLDRGAQRLLKVDECMHLRIVGRSESDSIDDMMDRVHIPAL